MALLRRHWQVEIGQLHHDQKEKWKFVPFLFLLAPSFDHFLLPSHSMNRDTIQLGAAKRLRARNIRKAKAQRLHAIEEARRRAARQQHLQDLAEYIENREQELRGRYKNLAEYLEEEAKVWITEENLEDKICDSLFENPCTTGLSSPSSSLFAFRTVVPSFERPAGYEDLALENVTPAVRDALVRASAQESEVMGLKELIRPLVSDAKDLDRLEEYAEELFDLRMQNTAERSKYVTDTAYSKDLMEHWMKKGGSAVSNLSQEDVEELKAMGHNPDEVFAFLKEQQNTIRQLRTQGKLSSSHDASAAEELLDEIHINPDELSEDMTDKQKAMALEIAERMNEIIREENERKFNERREERMNKED